MPIHLSDNDFPKVLFAEQAGDGATPESGVWKVYAKAGGLYLVDDAGAVTGPLIGASSVPSMWSLDVDDPLTSLDDVTTGLGTWSLDTYLKVEVLSTVPCRAFVDSPPLAHSIVAVVEVEVEIPAGFGSGHTLLVGFGDVSLVSSTSAVAWLVGGIKYDCIYFEQENAVAYNGPLWTAPAAGTWVTLRYMGTGSRGVLWVDGVKVWELQLGAGYAVSHAPSGFQPYVRAYGAVTWRFRNMRAWSLGLPGA